MDELQERHQVSSQGQLSGSHTHAHTRFMFLWMNCFYSLFLPEPTAAVTRPLPQERPHCARSAAPVLTWRALCACVKEAKRGMVDGWLSVVCNECSRGALEVIFQALYDLTLMSRGRPSSRCSDRPSARGPAALMDSHSSVWTLPTRLWFAAQVHARRSECRGCCSMKMK